MKRLVWLGIACLLAASAAFAQDEAVSWSEDFETYGARKTPPGWLDESNALFALGVDPRDTSNTVYGARHDGSRQRSVNRASPRDVPDIGVFTTLATPSFAVAGSFELGGRVYRATPESLFGITIGSTMPELPAAELIALWRRSGESSISLRYFAVREGTTTESASVAAVPAHGSWFRFTIRVDDARIRVRFWPDGQPEPAVWGIDTNLADGARAAGRIGLWSAAGETWFDDLRVTADIRAETDTTGPAIRFFERDTQLAAGSPTIFNRDARVSVHALDASGVASLEVTLDGQRSTSDVTIEAERTHRLRAVAIDTKGNRSETFVEVTVDKTPPIVRLTDGQLPFPEEPFLARAVVPVVAVEDQTQTSVTLLLDGDPFVSGTPVTAEQTHELTIDAKDAAGWTTTRRARFTIDLTAPTITLLDGASAVAGRITRGGDVRITIASTDANGVTETIVTLDGRPYQSGEVISAAGEHLLLATASDPAGNRHQVALVIVIDRVGPQVAITEGGAPLDGRLSNTALRPVITVSDPDAIVVATLNGEPFASGTIVDAERQHVLEATAKDALGNQNRATAMFTIDRTGPTVTFHSPQPEQHVGTRELQVTGNASDAVELVLNGVAASLGTNGDFLAVVDLVEGANTIVATAVDAAGNQGSGTVRVHLDTRAPELRILTPAPDGCLNGANVVLTGTARGAAVVRLRVNEMAVVEAVLTGDEWTSTVGVPEGPITITVEAEDAAGHLATAHLPLVVDRTAPLLEAVDGAGAFAGGLVSRIVAPSIRVVDADPSVSSTVTLNGQPYESGTPVAADGVYVLRASATDCSGNASAPLELTFIIDRSAPVFMTFDPASGTSVGTKPAIRGTLSEPATVMVEASGLEAVVTGTTFSLPLPLAEGTNEVFLVATDRAGNITRAPYVLRVKTGAPLVEIVESGAAIPPGALFTRTVRPVVRVDDPGAIIAATINGAPFVSGVALEADGSYEIIAQARNAFGRTSGEVRAAFAVDRTPPRVRITSPAEGSTHDADHVSVTGTVDADARSVAINGVAAAIDGTSFSTTVALEYGPSTLAATALDRAGNLGRHSIDITRGARTPSIILNSPPNNLLTNRPTTIVAGQVLSPPDDGRVTVNGVEVPITPGGTFKTIAVPLLEGPNTITASLMTGEGRKQATVAVLADFTPPIVTVTANGLDLADGSRFGSSPTLSITVSDARPEGLTRRITIDGEEVTEPGAFLDGAHTLVVVGRDAAGNETRAARTFFVGDSTLATGCALSAIVPAEGEAVSTAIVQVSGRSGGARAVLINGRSATVADGSFCGDADLRPGRNEIIIQCADSAGAPTDEPPVTLVLWRDEAATIAIDRSPGEIVTTSTIPVTGSVSGGVVGGEVNGVPFTLEDGVTTFRVDEIALTPGLNVITALGRTRAGRTAIATTTVTLRNASPQLTITSPLPASEHGGSLVDVSGTYLNVDPETIRVSGTTPSIEAMTDTSGTFRASVNIVGASTITASGRNAAGELAEASVTVHRVEGFPSIVIVSPPDNEAVPAGGSLNVTGTVDAPPGALVQVNGRQATINGTVFSATIDVPAAAGPLPIIARVTTVDGAGASDTARVHRYDPFAIRASYPVDGAAGVARGSAIVIVFNNTVDASTARALRLIGPGGLVVDGTHFIDRDAVTFAPNSPLVTASRYVVDGLASLRDASGGALARTPEITFTTESQAPEVAPIVDQLKTTGCFAESEITGRASAGGARLRIRADGAVRETVASDTGAFRVRVPFDGRPGFHLVRIQEVGPDGSLSPARSLCFRLTCDAPRVIGATLDRALRRLMVEFSRPMDATSLVVAAGGSVLLVPEGLDALSGTVSAESTIATVTFDSELPPVRLDLTITTEARDSGGAPLAGNYTQSFGLEGPASGTGRGYIAGAVYDASTGRPLPGATIRIDSDVITSDERGRYVRSVDEGAYTIEASAEGHTRVWRHIVVPAGAGMVPLDIRLTRRSEGLTVGNEPLELSHGADSSVTRRVDLFLPNAGLPPGAHVQLTATGAQSIAALLPLGWSPYAAAEISVDGATGVPLVAAELRFHVDRALVQAAGQTLSVVRYDLATGDWRVLISAANISESGLLAVPLSESGSYAVVYPDHAPQLAHPPPPATGRALRGVADVCRDGAASCAVASRSFLLEPRAVLPNGRAVATLVTEGGGVSYPSGTPVQATIDERLNAADGRVLLDPPFTTDLLLYRSLDGQTALADFHLAPSRLAAGVTLRDGVETIRIDEYPGRIERNALLGAEGGRVPGDAEVTIDVAPGATLEPLHARVAAIDADTLALFGNVPGFTVAEGFTLTLARTSELPPVDGFDIVPPVLAIPARASFTVPQERFTGATEQVVLAEVLPQTDYGVVFRMVAIATRTGSTQSGHGYVTRSIDSTQLPLEGIVREGQYLVLVAQQPIAYAYGIVRAGTTGIALARAQVRSAAADTSRSFLGVSDVTTTGGVFVAPVPAKPSGPFVLVPRSTSVGEGSPHQAFTSPDAGGFVDVDVLTLAPQAPRLVSLTPAAGEVDVAAPFVVRAEFDRAMDPASATDGIRVANLTTGVLMTGSIVITGSLVTFNADEPLRASSQYTVTIEGTLRAENGTPFGEVVVRSLTTSARPYGNTAFRPELIRITVPDASGRASVLGSAGALPVGAQAVAVRRGTGFVEAYQTTVSVDGSFRFEAGGGDARDAIGLADAIDLHVLDATSRAVVAIVPLTPFSREDGRAFVARPGFETRYVSVDGFEIVVPPGAFDVPTTIEILPGSVDEFAGIPGFTTELRYATSVRLSFEGVAAQPLSVEMPIPAGVDTSGDWLLAVHGNSVRGPRLMIADLLQVRDGAFITGAPEAEIGGLRAPVGNAVIVGPELRNHLIKVTHAGLFAGIAMAVGNIAWAITGVQGSFDLFWDAFDSLYVAHYYFAEGRGRVAVPVRTNVPFTVVGVDASTGLEAFTRVYDPIPASDSGSIVDVGDAQTDSTGPAPIFGSPFRIETFVLEVEDLPIESIRGFEISAANGRVSIRSAERGSLLNVTRGQLVHFDGDEATVEASIGDRFVIMAGAREVDPAASVSVVFDDELEEALTPVTLHDLVSIELYDPPTESFTRIDGALTYKFDSGRRITVATSGSLVRGGRYRLVVSERLKNRSGLSVGQVVEAAGNTAGLSEPLYFEFSVRAPKGEVGSFDLPEESNGRVRDQALSGNVLLIAAGQGGIVAYDVSDPAALSAAAAPIQRAEGAVFDYWSLAADHHGRVYATGMGSLFGVVQAFRLEDFTEGGSDPVQPIAGATVSYVPGAANGMQIPSGIIGSDRPEAYPRKIQILVQDSPVSYSLASLKLLPGAEVVGSNAGAEVLRLKLDRDRTRPYLVQRISVENVTRNLRWSADAIADQSAVIEGIIAYPGDDFRVVRNETTYAVISLFGFGIGVYDLNAIESNDASGRPPGYEIQREQIRLTDALRPPNCGVADPWRIEDLTLSPDAGIFPATDGGIRIAALEVYNGIVDLKVVPPSSATPQTTSAERALACAERSPTGLVLWNLFTKVDGSFEVHQPKRLEKLREAIEAAGMANPRARFSGVARYRWNAPDQNLVTTDPDVQPALGLRGTRAGSRGHREYMLIPAKDYGLLLVEMPSSGWLADEHLADIIWIPGGAYAVRVIPGTSIATVVSGDGRVLLVDLSRTDERWNSRGPLASDALFPTVSRVLGEGRETPDPRIIWRSKAPIAVGTLAPLIDPETGFLFLGQVLERTTKVLSVLEPKLRIKGDVGR